MSKIYRVKHTIQGHVGEMPAYIEAERYVRANNRQSAVNFVARDTLVANLATQDELVQAVTKGTKIEDASSPQLDFVDVLENSLKQDKASSFGVSMASLEAAATAIGGVV